MGQMTRPDLIQQHGWWVAVCLFLWLAVPAAADIYIHIDRHGVMHFSNVPTSDKYRIYIRERPQHQFSGVDVNRFDRYINEAAIRHGVDFPLVKAVIHAESAFDPRAVSRKGALGLMQIMPQNLTEFQIDDPFDPWQNIMGGTRYLKELIERFDGQLPLALAAYNAGPGTVDTYQGIPPFLETETYVKRVMDFLHLYQQ